jgi:L-seryl-tRNA(Ser) seleniumtransferase
VLSTLQATALAYLRRDGDAVPFWRMATVPVDELWRRASALGVGEPVTCVAVAGGGSVPGQEIPSAGVALAGDLTSVLRSFDPPVIARVEGGRTIVDLRTVDPSDDHVVAAALAVCLSDGVAP